MGLSMEDWQYTEQLPSCIEDYLKVREDSVANAIFCTLEYALPDRSVLERRTLFRELLSKKIKLTPEEIDFYVKLFFEI